jgi:hypothetical protein
MDMDEALAKRIEMLEKVRSNVTDVKQSCQRVEKQMTALAQQQGKLEMSAVQARRLGREDLARMALAKRDEAQMQLAQLKEQYKRLLAAEVKLAAAAQALEEKINAHAENRLGREKASKRTSPQYIVVKVLTNAFSIRAWAQRSESQVLHLARRPPFGMALGSGKVTLCGRPYNSSVGDVFRLSEATCRECKRCADIG